MKGEVVIKFGVPINGLVLNVPPDRVGPDALIDGYNVFVDLDGRLKVRRGSVSVTGSALNPAERVMGIATYEDNNSIFYPVVGTTKRWQALVSGAWTDLSGGITFLNGNSNDPVRFTSFASGGKNYILGVNNVDGMYEWDSTAGTYSLVAAAPVARDVVTLANRVVAFNTVEGGTRYPFRVRWSAINDQTTWPALAYNDMLDSACSIVGVALTSRISAVIYRQFAGWLIQAVAGGDANAFIFDRIPAGDHMTGPVGPSAIVIAEGNHYYFGVDGRIYMYNGSAISPISDPVDPLLRSAFNNSFPSRFNACYIPSYRQLCFFFANGSSTDPNAAIVFDLRRQAFEPLWTFGNNITASGEVREATGPNWTNWVGAAVTWTGTTPNNIPYSSWDSIPSGTQLSTYIGTSLGAVNRFAVGTTDAGSSINGIPYSATWGLQRAIDERYSALAHYIQVYQTPASVAETVSVELNGYFQPLGPETVITTLTLNLADGTTFYQTTAPGPANAQNIKSNLLQLFLIARASSGFGASSYGDQLDFAGCTVLVDYDTRGDYTGNGAQ